MRLIGPKNTKPELTVRKLVFSLGYRYRLHKRELPGTPDLVFPSRKKVVFVHGCFWHQHGCGKYSEPKSRQMFWSKKLTDNVLRDMEVRATLNQLGWKVLVVWECEARGGAKKLAARLKRFLR